MNAQKPFILALLFLSFCASGQIFDMNRTVQLSADIDEISPSITLNWIPFDSPSGYQIFRKRINDNNWGFLYGAADSSATSFTDNNVDPGQLYEYLVVRIGSSENGFGFISSGINFLDPGLRQTLVIVLDTSIIPPTNPVYRSYKTVVESEGYRVIPLYVHRNQEVTGVRQQISDIVRAEPLSSYYVLLLGHVPVPYSGNIAPDAHNNHMGAWPADTYYGELDDDFWTDVLVDNTTASGTRNDNVPGDGKFDQNTFESLDIAVGRVDFANMPAFERSELELLENYLRKNIRYRTGMMRQNIQSRGLIENNFPNFEEGFGQNGLRNFPTFFGPDSTKYLDFNNAKTDPYYWVYGCGGGNFTGASGISNTTSMANDSVQSIFTLFFGSYFGDWDSPNNFLRAALGSGTILTNAWAGRPNLQFHHMAMGAPIGFSMLRSLNNTGGVYLAQFGARGVHTGLLGDPTLRMFPIEDPVPESMSASVHRDGVHIRWNGIEDSDGYLVYVKGVNDPFFSLVTAEPIFEEEVQFPCPASDSTFVFLVKNVKKEQTASGIYYNMSQGAIDTININQDYSVTADFSYLIGDQENTIIFENLSDSSYVPLWLFGDGQTSNDYNPVHTYDSSGIYTVTLIVNGPCDSDTVSQEVDVTVTSISNPFYNRAFKIFPNPVSSFIRINSSIPEYEVVLRSVNGLVMLTRRCSGMDEVDITSLPGGTYLVEFYVPDGQFIQREKIVKMTN